MSLKDEITAAEVKNRIPGDLLPSDLLDIKVDQYIETISGWIEDLTQTTFATTSDYFNTAKLLAINYAAILSVVYSDAVPDANASFSPDGELKVSLSAMPRAIANFVSSTLGLAQLQLKLLTTNLGALPTSLTATLEDMRS